MPTYSNLTQEQEMKLRAYEAYISKSRFLDGITDPRAKNDKLAQVLTKDEYNEFVMLMSIQAGMTIPDMVQDPANQDLILSKKTEQAQDVKRPDPNDLTIGNAQLKVLHMIYSDPKKLLDEWDTHSWCLDKNPPERRYVQISAKDVNDCPAYWNSENDFSRFANTIFDDGTAEDENAEQMRNSVIEWTKTLANPGAEKKAVEELLKEKPKTVEEENALVWKSLMLLGRSKYFNTELIGYEYGKTEDGKDWLAKLKEKAKLDGVEATINDLEKSIEKRKNDALKESKRFKWFRSDEAIAEHLNKAAEMTATLDELKKPLTNQQAYIDKIEISTDERVKQRNQIYRKINDIVSTRKTELFERLSRGQLPNGDYDPTMHSEGDAYDWLEKQKKGQAASYRRLIALDSAFAGMNAHYKLMQAKNTLKSAVASRDKLERMLNDNIDGQYAKQPSLNAIQQITDSAKDNLNRLEKDINKRRAEVDDKKGEFLLVENKHKADVDELRKASGKNDARIDEIIEEEFYKGKNIENLQKSLKGAEYRIRRFSDNIEDCKKLIPLEESKQPLLAEIEQIEKDYPIAKEYNNIDPNYLSKPDPSGLNINSLSFAGSDLYSSVGKLRYYVFMKKNILDELLKLSRAVKENGQALPAEEFAICKNNCLQLFQDPDFQKDLSGGRQPAGYHYSSTDYRKIYNEQAAEMFPKKSGIPCAPFGEKYGESDLHFELITKLGSATTQEDLIKAVEALLAETEAYANRLKVECHLVRDQQSKESVDAVKDLLDGTANKEIKKANSKFKINWPWSDPNAGTKKGHALEELYKYSYYPDPDQKKTILEIFENVNQQDKIINKMFKHKDSLLMGAMDLENRKTELQKQLNDIDVQMKTTEGIDPEIVKMLDNNSPKVMLQRLQAALKSAEKEQTSLPLEIEKEKNKLAELKNEKKECQNQNQQNSKKIQELNKEFAEKKSEFEKQHKEVLESDKELKELDNKYITLNLEIEKYHGILENEIPNMTRQFQNLVNKNSEMERNVKTLIKVEDLSVLKNTDGSYDLDKTHFFSKDFRKAAIDDLTVFFDNARTVTRKLKNEDSNEYLGMMNAVADAVGKPHLRQEWGPVNYSADEKNTAEAKSLNHGDLTSCLDTLKAIKEAADKYIDAKSREFRPFESEMRKKRLQASHELRQRVETAINQLVGYPRPGQETGKDGLIHEVNEINKSFNRVKSPFGKNKKGNPFELYNERKKVYMKGEPAYDVNGDLVECKDDAEAEQQALFDACITPIIKEKEEQYKTIDEIPTKNHLHPETIAKRKALSKEKEKNPEEIKGLTLEKSNKTDPDKKNRENTEKKKDSTNSTNNTDKKKKPTRGILGKH